MRQFAHAPAKRIATPLLFGLIGPSGSGKTYSALRLATGMARVNKGPIFMIDTEGNRGLHYADRFKYEHVPFKAPFSPTDYEAALQHCVNSGAATIIIDSMSHEHTGVGGVLEWHERETKEIAERWKLSGSKGFEKANMSAWQKPKAARLHLIDAITQCGKNVIMCFRAKDKIRIEQKGKTEIVKLGFMPQAGEEFVYELTAKALLLPGADGVPTWNPENPGEKMMTKLPIQFRELFSGRAGKPLDEDTGAELAAWAAGGASPEQPAANPGSDEFDDLLGKLEICQSNEFDKLRDECRKMYPTLSETRQRMMTNVIKDAEARLSAA